jgi:uncharacterized damage-inducible protein DinB
MNRPYINEYAEFYQKYIDTVDNDVIDELETQAYAFPEFLRAIPSGKEDYKYAPGKWSIKELVGHVIDTERIMTYRALRFARNDSTAVAGFDEEHYVAHAHFSDRTLEGFAEEFNLLRRSNLHFFRSLTESELARTGTANGASVSVRALLFIIAGHLNHHRRIITERYLI